MFRREITPAQGYLVATGATVIVGCLRLIFADSLQEIPPFVPFAIPVILAGWFGGLRPALVATSLCGMVAIYFLMSSDWLQRMGHIGMSWRLAVFLGVGIAISAFFESWHANRRRLLAEHLGLEQTQAALRLSEARLAAELEAMGRLRELTTRLPLCPDLTTAAHEILDALISLHGAEMGNVQLYNSKSESLEIVAQRGLPQAFLDHFRVVRVDDDSAGGRALKAGTRVVIEDVNSEPGYEAHREIAAIAGYRAVQSTPLLSRLREPLGMLSTHFREPHRPSERDLWVIDLYARQAADYIERIRGEERLQQRVDENERGHDVSTAYDGQEAVDAVGRDHPEVVLLDIGLPKLNGYEAARQIRMQPSGKDVELIAITGWGQEEDKRRAFEAGFDHHLTKPVEAAVLKKLLAESIAVPSAR